RHFHRHREVTDQPCPRSCKAEGEHSVNRTKAKRWLNEYLDGEIGLADKAEFERLMAQDPELRREYEQMRRIGLLMSSGPEVEVHPSAFRAKLMERIEPQ